MSEHYPIMPLGEVVLDMKDGGTPKRSVPENFGGDINWCVVKDIKPEIFDSKEKLTQQGLDKSSAKLWPANSIIISLGATIGKIGIARVPTATKQGLSGIVVNEELITVEFLVYVLHHKVREIQGLATGTTIKEVRPRKLMSELKIPVPPLEEQQRIVSILDEAFHKISKSTETMGKNLRNTLNLLISTREQCFTPKPHWLQSQLDELCKIKHGFAFKSQFFSQLGDFVLLTPGNFFETGGYRDRGEKQKFYTGEIPEGYILEKGDLLVAMTEQAAGLLGSPIIVPESDRFLHNQRLGLINWNGSQTMSNEFVYHFFNTHTVRQELHNTGTGIKVRHTSPTKIGNLKIAIPPTIEEQQEIADKLNSIEQEVSNLGLLYENKTAIMSQLKQSILQETFNGNLAKEIAA